MDRSEPQLLRATRDLPPAGASSCRGKSNPSDADSCAGPIAYRTLTACDGADAIAVFAPRAAEVRLLLTDLQMPILGGPALAAALRRMRSDLPVVAMSGVDSHASAMHKEFTTAFLAKPFQAETLLAIVRRTLDAAGLRSPA